MTWRADARRAVDRMQSALDSATAQPAPAFPNEGRTSTGLLDRQQDALSDLLRSIWARIDGRPDAPGIDQFDHGVRSLSGDRLCGAHVLQQVVAG
ncbi:MAG TPA: hypothetical protein VLT15_00360 [Acidimicrobiia bacterium]|nr:hypothetical protein [Acidimicrobiia bacterium]